MNGDVLLEISDRDFDSTYIIPDISSFLKRNSSRGLVFYKNKIAILNVVIDKHHKLPGGGFEGEETAEEAFYREVLEETGCKCEIREKIGTINEIRCQRELNQISVVFAATVTEKVGEPQFDEGERGAGYVLEWFTLDEAIKIIENDKPEGYEAKYVNRRDRFILNFYKAKSSSPSQLSGGQTDF